jgi:hypothetical protein
VLISPTSRDARPAVSSPGPTGPAGPVGRSICCDVRLQSARRPSEYVGERFVITRTTYVPRSAFSAELQISQRRYVRRPFFFMRRGNAWVRGTRSYLIRWYWLERTSLRDLIIGLAQVTVQWRARYSSVFVGSTIMLRGPSVARLPIDGAGIAEFPRVPCPAAEQQLIVVDWIIKGQFWRSDRRLNRRVERGVENDSINCCCSRCQGWAQVALLVYDYTVSDTHQASLKCSCLRQTH